MAGLDIQSLMALLQARGNTPGQGPSQFAGESGGIAQGGRQIPMDAIRRRVNQAGGPPPGGAVGGGLGGPPGGGMGDMMSQLSGQGGGGPEMELQGMPDPRGMVGQLARGSNVYNGAGAQAQAGGGPQFGPPVGNQNAAGGMPGEDGLPPRNALLRRILEQRSGGNGLFA